MNHDNPPKILVTGATGFIGRNLCPLLKQKGFFIRGTVRNQVGDSCIVDEYFKVGDINESTDWQKIAIDNSSAQLDQ